MLYRVEIENFFSIKENQIIDLCVRKSVEDPLGHFSPLFPSSKERAPNVVAIFGPNAAGKSNVLRAITFATWFVRNSFEIKHGDRLPFQKFGSSEHINAPTRLSFSMAGPVNILDVSGDGPLCPYTYELEIGPRIDNMEDQVTLERLSYQPNHKGRYSRIFERSSEGNLKYAKGFLSSKAEIALKIVLRSNASIISTLAQLNHPVAQNYILSIESIVSNIFLDKLDTDEHSIAQWYAKNPSAFEKLRDVIKRIDLGIEDLGIILESGQPELRLQHIGIDQIMTFNRESHGTQQFLKIFPIIIMALQHGGIAVIDEIDSAIHPMILPEILRWFSDPTQNPHNAQIWTTCHAATLLSELTKEEVLFCEKSHDGATSIYSLSEIDKVRRDENFSGKYLGGEYGAIPMVG